jgi:hypothetical protein
MAVTAARESAKANPATASTTNEKIATIFRRIRNDLLCTQKGVERELGSHEAFGGSLG